MGLTPGVECAPPPVHCDRAFGAAPHNDNGDKAMSARAPARAAACRRAAIATVLTAFALTACGGDDNTTASAPPPPTAADCTALATATGLPNATTTITSATFTAATATVAEHCL